MVEYYKIWEEQVEAAKNISEEFGLQKALGYLIGEKFLDFLKDAEKDQNLKNELSDFIHAIKKNFDVFELKQYFENTTRVGTMGHTTTDEDYDVLMKTKLFDDSTNHSEQSRRYVAIKSSKRITSLIS